MMTPKEGSQLCIKMAGYGIRHDVVQAIQEDAMNSLLDSLGAPKTKFKNEEDYESFDRPMTIQERINWLKNHENR